MADSIDVIEMFKQAAFEVDNRKLPELTRETVIATLGMDSVAIMELVSYFEEKLAIRIPDEDLGRIRTVGDFRDETTRDRLAMLVAGFGLARAHPIVGIGPGQVKNVYPAVATPQSAA